MATRAASPTCPQPNYRVCRRYSPWGVAFNKSFLFNTHNANPVMYCRPEILKKLVSNHARDKDLLRYLTLFHPKYSKSPGKFCCDFMHEREWRTPGPAPFTWKNLEWVSVPSEEMFKSLLPDLYADIKENGVTIMPIGPVNSPDRCSDGYNCINVHCQAEHTKDQMIFFEWLASQ